MDKLKIGYIKGRSGIDNRITVLRMGKAAGNDDMAPELIKWGGKRIIDKL